MAANLSGDSTVIMDASGNENVKLIMNTSGENTEVRFTYMIAMDFQCYFIGN